jgi:hypothetical protein
MERSKFLSSDRRWLLKFEGLGHYGEAPRERGQILSDGRFSPRPEGNQHGYTCYPVVKGTPLAASDLTRAVLDRMAQYCAFRKTTMSTPAPATNLAPMLRHNLEQELGVDFESIHLPFDMADLYASAPIVADARMMPHDWIACGDGRLLKVDATCHGDDHFFPGPTDIAWDLAGAIVEWRMEDSAAQYLLEQYRRSSADHQIASRLPAYLLAYSVFRMAYCRMAAAAIQGAALQDNEEHSRLQRAYRAYRQLVDRQVAAPGESRSGHRPLAAGGA